MSKNKKIGVVYSTDPDFEYKNETSEEPDTLPPADQLLRVSLDKKQRNGKKVTLIEDFVGKTEDLKSLEKELKTKCGVGGSSKDGYILVQGDYRQKVKEILNNKGYKVKVI